MKNVCFFVLILLVFLYCNNIKIFNTQDKEIRNKNKIQGGNKNIIDKLDKIYFINLDKSKDRLDKMLDQSKDHNLNLTRYSAIYGKNIDRNELIKNNILDKNNELKNGELGVTLSHINLWKESLKNNYEYISFRR